MALIDPKMLLKTRSEPWLAHLPDQTGHAFESNVLVLLAKLVANEQEKRLVYPRRNGWIILR